MSALTRQPRLHRGLADGGLLGGDAGRASSSAPPSSSACRGGRHRRRPLRRCRRTRRTDSSDDKPNAERPMSLAPWSLSPNPSRSALAVAVLETVRPLISGNHGFTDAETTTVTRLPDTETDCSVPPAWDTNAPAAAAAVAWACAGLTDTVPLAEQVAIEGVGTGPGRLHGDRRTLPIGGEDARRVDEDADAGDEQHREQHDEGGQVPGARARRREPAAASAIALTPRTARSCRSSPAPRPTACGVGSADLGDALRLARHRHRHDAASRPLAGRHGDARPAGARGPGSCERLRRAAAAAAWAAPASRSIDAARAATAAAWVTPSRAVPWRPA